MTRTIRGIALAVLAMVLLPPHADAVAETPPLVTGDEPYVTIEHEIATTRGPLRYRAVSGRIPIRVERTGELRGYLFFVAYVVPSATPRPLTFAWNGGPLAPSAIVHMEGLGPRRRADGVMVDNPDTLLTDTDLVFMDAAETGFSRPARPEFASDFMSMRGDVAVTAEFIRAWRAKFHAIGQPTYLLGESYGAFRAAAVADLMTGRRLPLAGVMLISGDIPNIPQPPAFYDAMHVPARTAAAFARRRLEPDLLRDRDATMRQAVAWSRDIYLPALERADRLTPAERARIIAALARYTAFPPDRIDPRTLVVHADDYLRFAGSPDGSAPLSENDLRIWQDAPGNEVGDPALTDRYIRGELGYATDLAYAGVERGYVPSPGPKLPTIAEQWEYNQTGVTPEVMAEFRATGEVSPVARVNPPWIVDALRRDPSLRVFVATGRYDPLNMCEGVAIAAATLPPALSHRIATRCYEGGHIILRDDVGRPRLLADLHAFLRGGR